MKSATNSIDVAKNVFEIAVSRRLGKVFETHRLSRVKLLPFFARRDSSTVIMEACSSAHHWVRKLSERGHRPVLLPPAYVLPYVRRNRTDRADAVAVLEAFRNEEIHPVPVKSVSQAAGQQSFRIDTRWQAAAMKRKTGPGEVLYSFRPMLETSLGGKERDACR